MCICVCVHEREREREGEGEGEGEGERERERERERAVQLMQISSQAIADCLSNIADFQSFGFSLDTVDFDNNKHNGQSVFAT